MLHSLPSTPTYSKCNDLTFCMNFAIISKMFACCANSSPMKSLWIFFEFDLLFPCRFYNRTLFKTQYHCTKKKNELPCKRTQNYCAHQFVLEKVPNYFVKECPPNSVKVCERLTGWLHITLCTYGTVVIQIFTLISKLFW